MSGKVDILSRLGIYHRTSWMRIRHIDISGGSTMLRDVATRQSTTMLRFKWNNGERGFTQMEAALKLGVSVRTIQRMIARCDLRTIVVGRRKYITPIDIDRLLFKPSRLQAIIAEIDAMVAAWPHRKQLEGTPNG